MELVEARWTIKSFSTSSPVNLPKGRVMRTRHPEHASNVCRFDALRGDDVALVGGKNASLGELCGAMTNEGTKVPAQRAQ